jgi:dipeptidase D
MVSFGPTIRGAHSPDEAALVETVNQFWDLCEAVLLRLGSRADMS